MNRIIDDKDDNTENEIPNLIDLNDNNSAKKDKITQTTCTKNDELKVKYECLLTDNIFLQEQLTQQRELHKFNILQEDSFKNDNGLVEFYTGLHSYKHLKIVFDIVKSYVTHGSMSKLEQFNEFVITLAKLRLNLLEKDLAYRFNVSQPTISNIFHKWLKALSIRLKFLITWPEREQLRKTMPACFKKHFSKCVVIIDCFEIFIEKPNDLLARAQTFSNYKHHNTVKVLVGITPQGTISFISEAWGGRTSDVFLTENCGVLANLLPGDVVLADRGFTIEESVNMYCAELKIPAFTRGKNNFHS